jgi:hypothetical protein
MSLISDALKKARQEAARQDSLRQGVPYAVGSVEPPARRNPLLPLFAGLGAGCLAAGVLFAVAYMAGWGPFGRPEPETRVAEATSTAPQSSGLQAAEPASPPSAVMTETAEITEVTPPPAQAEPQAPPPAAAPAPEQPQPQIEMRPTVPVEPPVVRVEPQTTPPPAPAPVEERPAQAPVPQAPAAPAPEASGDLTDAKVYVAELPVPGDEPVKLNGIAFSQDQPVAVLDGRVMGPGETIKGFTIISIESGRVKLQGHGTTVYLAPK